MQSNIRQFLFSLQGTHSNVYGGAFFAKKSEQLKVGNYFCKKAPPQTFDWVLNMALINTVKKIHLKYISQLFGSLF